jgi:hypothetical protein
MLDLFDRTSRKWITARSCTTPALVGNIQSESSPLHIDVTYVR